MWIEYFGDGTEIIAIDIDERCSKHFYHGNVKTIIGDQAFIGSNSSLVAPVRIGNGATVGAGSTITRDVEDNSLAVESSKQFAKENYPRPQKIKK